MNPRILIDPEVAEWAGSEFWRKIRLGERLTHIEAWLHGEVAIYEYDCTGSSRNADLLSDDLRKECDERGPLSPIEITSSEVPTWSDPEPGTPSTEDRFLGRSERSADAAD